MQFLVGAILVIAWVRFLPALMRANLDSHGVGGYSHTLFRPDTRVVLQSRNKVHVAGGYTRFQEDNTTISVTWGLSVHVRRDLVWGSVAGTGNTIHYDATNNAHR